MLTEFGRGMNEDSENFKKEMENTSIRKDQTEVTELKNIINNST